MDWEGVGGGKGVGNDSTPCNGELLAWDIPRPIIEGGGWWGNSQIHVEGGWRWWVGGLIPMPMCRGGVGHSRFNV